MAKLEMILTACLAVGCASGSAGWAANSAAPQKPAQNAGVDEVQMTAISDSTAARPANPEGADESQTDENGLTLLMCAAAQGRTDIVQALIKAGADADAKDNDGLTALMYAAMEGHADAVKLLLEAGADVNAKAAEGHTVLDIANAAEGLTVLDMAKSDEVKALLTKAGAK